MTLNLGTPCWLSRLSHPSPFLSKLATPFSHNTTFLLLVFGTKNLPLSSFHNSKTFFNTKASLGGESENGVAENNSVSELLLNDELLNRVSSAKDANEALDMIAEMSERNGGVVNTSDCCSIISAALDRNNADLAMSVFYAMRSSFDQAFLRRYPCADEGSNLVERWKWVRPDVQTYTLLVRGLAASLRVSDALRIIASVCRVGVSPGEEVPFGKVVKCPNCMIAAAVAQPQHGIQVVSCSKCRYQYEFVSGDIVNIESEEISMDIPAWERGLRLLRIKKQSVPAAVHSIVVQTPSGMARTHRFATETVDVPAQEGERVTIALAAPSNVYREVGPLKFSPKVPNFYPGEPMCLTNHKDGRESLLLRAPKKDQSSSSLNPYILFPLLAAVATGDAASRIIDPSLPQFISVAAVASLALGSTLTTLVLPQFYRLPQRLVDTIAIRQQLLSQYYILQSRIKDLREASEKEVFFMEAATLALLTTL